jgi:alpha-1,2-mannosyltransferase
VALPGPVTGRRLRLGLQAAAVAGLAVAIAFYIGHQPVRPPWHHTFDLRVYRGAVRWWLDGRPLYDFLRPHTQKGFTYPPFAVLCLLPLALGTETTATVLLTSVTGVLVGITTWQLVAPVAARHGWSRGIAVGIAVPLACAMEPIRETLGWGQVDVLLAALVLADVAALRRGRRWAGAGIGLATALKVTPGLVVLHLALSRRWRAATVAAGVALAATLLGYAVDPAASVRYWTRTLWQTGRVGHPVDTNDQSLLGLLSRLAAPRSAAPAVWAVLAGAVLAGGLWRAARLARGGDELGGVTVTGLVACLISPVSWTHHLYWVVPAAVVLLDVAAGTPVRTGWPQRLRARPRATAVTAGAAAVVVVGVFSSSVIWFAAGDTAHGRGGILAVAAENAYVLVMLALVAGLPGRAPAEAPLTAGPAGPSAARTPAPPPPAGSSPR